ncbi:MAG: YdeI/OmpD-associated family protein [Chitinophagaceae bacterium]|nr:YdeI/OmpD-associated family protein [Chitinophagaceae bacterium]
MKKNKLVDEYIDKVQPFAKQVLMHLRQLIHETCPDVEEKIKWGMPSFEYKGMMCGFAAFKQHCTFMFWKAPLMKDSILMENAKSETSMGHLGRITSLKDLPSDKKIIGYIKEAMRLNELGIKVEKKKIPLKDMDVPVEFLAAIKKNKKAFATFEAFSNSNKKEYIDWFTEAKTEATKQKRLLQAIEWMAEGKPRNWKYMKS